MQLPRLFLITDRKRTPQPLHQAVRSALSAIPPGRAAILLREKDLDGKALLTLATELRAVTRERDSVLVISSRWDVALACEADGAHLGGDSPPIRDVRASVGRRLLLGASLHGEESAPAEADYAFISPVFATQSKPGVTPIGLDGVKRCSASSASTPVFALGGISTPQQITSCFEHGAFGVATLGAVLTSTDPSTQAALLWQAINAQVTVAR